MAGEPVASEEMLKLVIVILDSLKKALADGKITILDLPKLAPVIVALRKAMPDAKKIAAELKDLDPAGAEALLGLVGEVVEKIFDLFMPSQS